MPSEKNGLQSELLDTPEAAAEIHHSPRTLIRWRNQGVGPPFVRLGRKVLYRRKALTLWVEARELQPIREAE